MGNVWFEFLVLAFIKSGSPFTIYFFEQFFLIWKWHKAGDANDTSYLGYVWNCRQHLYFSVLVISASFLLLDIPFAHCTWNRFLETAETQFFRWKIIQNLIFVYVLVQKRAELIAEKLIFGRRKRPVPTLNIICTVLSI